MVKENKIKTVIKDYKQITYATEKCKQSKLIFNIIL